jgi:predicted metal-dependent hydrolase
MVLMPDLRVGDLALTYTVEVRVRRRRVAVRVDGPTAVTVLVPAGFDTGQVPALLTAHAEWLRRQLARPRASAPPDGPAFLAGSDIRWLGQRLTLHCVEGEGPGTVIVHPAHLIIRGRGATDGPASVRELFRAGCLEEAKRYLPGRVEAWAASAGQRPHRLKIACYRSRWGYCQNDGLIALNALLMQAPPSVIDYVVVHELTHLRFPHHQAPFWRRVARLLPDHERSRAWLKKHGREIL